MEIVRLNKDRKRALCILAALLVFFMTMLAACGVGVYNDSDQYITMHIHRGFSMWKIFPYKCHKGRSKGAQSI